MKHLVLFITSMIIWLLLTWSLEIQQFIAGIIVSFLVSIFLARIYRKASFKLFNPIRWVWFIVYTLVFAYYCLKANLDVAYRVLHPALPIRPAIIKVRMDLVSDVARTFLANSITLTPGTLTVDMTDDGYLYVHWINVTTFDPQEQTDIIVKRFEKLIRRIFE